MVHGFINKAYAITQALAIRRLADKKKAKGSRGVYSLYRLVKDIDQSIGLMTRRNVLDALGLPYDYETPEREAHDRAEQQAFAGGLGSTVSMPRKVGEASDWHEAMDELCGVDAADRSEDDTPGRELFQGLCDQLENVCGDVVDHVNKFVAHAATPTSRETCGPSEGRITWGAIWRAEEAICKVAGFIERRVLSTSVCPFGAICAFDVFRYIDQPLVSKDDVGRLKKDWEAFRRRIESWASWSPRQPLQSWEDDPSSA